MMRKILTIVLALLAAGKLAAQLPHTYYCDFEDATENANWNLNTPKNENYEWPNQWTIGTAEHASGSHSLYLSTDGGTTAGYIANASIVLAWRELTLETGEYDITFDWKNVGDSMRATMLVAWVPEKDFEDVWCTRNTNYKVQNWINNNLLIYNNTELFCGASVWSHALMHFTSDGTPHRLVFLYLTSIGILYNPPAACVDDIHIAHNVCGEPSNRKVNVTGQIVNLSWEGVADSYNIKFQKIGVQQPVVLKNIKGNSVSYTLESGVYNVYIQSICNGEESVWYEFPIALVHDPLCFDYLSLTDERCSYSEETASDYHNNTSLLQPGKIDYGFTSMYSRHTIHYRPEEYDARTQSSVDSKNNPVPPLKTVPEGALASVRIGSWEKAARVARIEYDFVVDANEASVLMLQYALVLQSSGHSEEQRPRLTIDIVDAETDLPLSKCTTVDLAAQTSGDGWYRVPMDSIKETDQDVCWRDWTTLGLNLADYDKKHVKVRITALGCTASVHYGYAYFTLTCTSGKLQGIQCGWTPTNEFIAPAGFNYRWYLVDAPYETLSRKDTFPVDYRDIRDYAVDITYKSDPSCGFTLYANAIPRFPIPEASYTLEQRDCGNYISFTNTSHIRTRNWMTGEQVDTSFPPEYLLWDFDGLNPEGLDTQAKRWAPSFRLPDDEADYHFKLYAGVGLCDSVQHIYVHVPQVGKDSIIEDVQRCEGELYRHNGKYFQSDTTIIDHDYNIAGCDSFYTINLRFVDAIRDTIEAVISEGSSYTVGTQTFSVSGVYNISLTSVSGCDSIVTLQLEVVTPLKMEISAIEYPCPEAASFLIETHARKGIPDFYTLSFGEEGYAIGLIPQSDSLRNGINNTIEVPMPAGVKPGYYPFSLAFDSRKNGKDTVTAELTIYYSASLIQQRWDDVLGILNSEYNGGYNFTQFQWYRNEQAIEGATEAYLYIEEKLKAGDTYAVEMKQDGEARALRTCAYVVPATAAAPDAAPQKTLQNGHIVIRVNGHTYNAQGMKIGD